MDFIAVLPESHFFIFFAISVLPKGTVRKNMHFFESIRKYGIYHNYCHDINILRDTITNHKYEFFLIYWDKKIVALFKKCNLLI